MKFFASTLAVVLSTAHLASAHFQIVHPSWRGNTLDEDSQWKYPCGGLPVGQNRTEWPVSGGALSVIPGWNAGHPTAFFYINMNLGNDPQNFTFPIAPVFQIVGPSRDPYPGTFCLPDLPLPANFTVKPGDNATIQVIQVALHGASLYNCADITFVADEDYKFPDECKNSSTIGFNAVYTTRLSSAGFRSISLPASISSIVGATAAFALWSML